MSRNKKRVTSCATKIGHSTLDEASLVLRKTLPAGMTEEMKPYPCFLCGKWHNGHEPVARLNDHEPICGCRHQAMDHRRFPERGCLICGNRCQSTLEEAYRSRIKYLAESAIWRGRFAKWLLRRWPTLLRTNLVLAFNRERYQRETKFKRKQIV